MPAERPDEFQEFLEQFVATAIRAPDLPDDQRELYFRLIQQHVFPKFSKLAEVVARKGDASPWRGEPKRYSHKTTNPGKSEAEYLSLFITTHIQPEPFTISDVVVGNEVASIGVSNEAIEISFRMLEDGRVAFTNDSRPGVGRLLDSPAALFEPIPSHPLFPAGNPATWIDRVVRRGMLQQAESELAAMPNAR